MNRLLRSASALTAVTILGLSLTACGDDEPADADESSASESADGTEGADVTETDATDGTTETDTATEESTDETPTGAYPTDADTKVFCDAFTGSFEVLKETEEGGVPSEEDWALFVEELEKLGAIGTPADIGAEERHGFEVYIDTLTTIDYDVLVENKDEDTLPGLSEEDNAAAETFSDWAFSTCLEL